MRFFRRDAGRADEQSRIEEFWRWWAGMKGVLDEAHESGRLAEHVDQISRHVKSISEGLAWELAKGTSAKHMLVVTPEGDPVARPTALAWLQAAPAPDSTWEYHASRQPGPLGILEIGEARIDLDLVRIATSWDDTRRLLSVTIWHPAFDGLPEAVQRRVASLFLDGLLGEDDVERWIGAIEVAVKDPRGIAPEAFRDEIAQRAAAGDPEGSWVLLQGNDRRGKPVLVLHNAALKRIDHPAASHHLAVTVERGLEQLSGSPEPEELDGALERLTAALSSTAVEVSRVTERRQRTVHFVTADSTRALEIAGAWAKANAKYRPRLASTIDERWTFRDSFGL